MSETLVLQDPVFTPQQVDQINQSVNLTFHLNFHGTKEDAQRVLPYLETADIIVPEYAGWTPALRDALSVYAADRTQKSLMTDERRALGRLFAEYLFKASDYDKGLFPLIRNSGKQTEVIDVQRDHEIFNRVHTAGTHYFYNHFIDQLDSGVFTTDLNHFSTLFRDISYPTRDRELIIRNSLHALLNDVASAPDKPIDAKTTILSTIGATHKVTTDFIRATGVNAKLTPDSILDVDPYHRLVQLAMNGNRITKLDMARGLLTYLFTAAAECYIDPDTQPNNKVLAKLAITNYFADGMDIESMRKLWESPEEQVDDRFRQAIDTHGLHAYDSSRRKVSILDYFVDEASDCKVRAS